VHNTNVKVVICETVQIYEWQIRLERCVSCNMECLNKTGLSMNWKCCVPQYIVHLTTEIHEEGQRRMQNCSSVRYPERSATSVLLPLLPETVNMCEDHS
jgi:hypothetical protein